MALNIDKCKVMHVWRPNIHSKYYMNDVKLRDTSEVVIADKHCAHAYSKVNRILGMIKRTVVSCDIHILLNLYKTLVRPHSEHCSLAWSPHYQKDKQLLERVQNHFTRLFSELRNLCYNTDCKGMGYSHLKNDVTEPIQLRCSN